MFFLLFLVQFCQSLIAMETKPLTLNNEMSCAIAYIILTQKIELDMIGEMPHAYYCDYTKHGVITKLMKSHITPPKDPNCDKDIPAWGKKITLKVQKIYDNAPWQPTMSKCNATEKNDDYTKFDLEKPSEYSVQENKDGIISLFDTIAKKAILPSAQ